MCACVCARVCVVCTCVRVRAMCPERFALRHAVRLLCATVAAARVKCSAVPSCSAARPSADVRTRACAPVGRYAGERCTAVARPGLRAHSAGARPTPTRSALQSPDATTQAQRVASRRRESRCTARVRERRPHRRVAWRGNVRPQWHRCGPCLRATHRRPRSHLGPARSARDLRSAPSRATCKQSRPCALQSWPDRTIAHS